MAEHEQSAMDRARAHIADAASDAADTAGDAVETAGDYASEAADRMAHAADDFADRAESFGDQVSDMVKQNPLGAVGCALGAGVVIGFILRAIFDRD